MPTWLATVCDRSVPRPCSLPGDQTVNASTVLPWLLHVLGAPTALAGLLVPVRKAGSGDRRTTCVAVSNSVMGLVLLLVGALSSALVVLDIRLALILLAGMGLAGVFAATRLPAVSAG